MNFRVKHLQEYPLPNIFFRKTFASGTSFSTIYSFHTLPPDKYACVREDMRDSEARNFTRSKMTFHKF